MAAFSVFIPTRDSSKRIGVFLDAYRNLGIEPLHIVDSRTKDDTVEVLKEKSANYFLFEPSGDFVEAGMIEFGVAQLETPWALRFDDDEFPSRHLLENCDALCAHPEHVGWWLSRREVCFHKEKFVFFAWPTRAQLVDNKSSNNPPLNKKLRLFRRDRASFSNQVHTQGVVINGSLGDAPPEAFFAHMNAIVFSPAERVEKIRKYARYNELAAWMNADEYLPELLEDTAYIYSNSGIEEFFPLLESALVKQNEAVILTQEELYKMMKYLLRAFGERLNSQRSWAESLRKRLERTRFVVDHLRYELDRDGY